jgi:hypothetical protein
MYMKTSPPVKPIATTTSLVQNGHCSSPVRISSVVLRKIRLKFSLLRLNQSFGVVQNLSQLQEQETFVVFVDQTYRNRKYRE